MPGKRATALALQSAYYIGTGIWPLLDRASFEAVTGKKRDWWLVQMVGLLALTNGIALAAGNRQRPSRETLTLAFVSSLSFAAIDIVYACKRTISPVYLADAAIELAIACAVALDTAIPP